MTGHAQGTHIFLPGDNLLQTTKAINAKNDTRINKYSKTCLKRTLY